MILRFLVLGCLVSDGAMGAPQWVGRFEAGEGGLPSGWKIEHLDKSFPPTQYRRRHWDGIPAVEARANGSMAVLARPVRINLDQTPVLCWRWRIDAPLVAADITNQSRDDYAARVYVTFAVPHDALDLAARAELALARSIYDRELPDAAVVYVWDNRYPVNAERANAHSERARMIVVESGPAKAGRWVSERRNVAADFKRGFANIPGWPTALAIASDTDDTGESAHAGFADFHFTTERESCSGF